MERSSLSLKLSPAAVHSARIAVRVTTSPYGDGTGCTMGHPRMARRRPPDWNSLLISLGYTGDPVYRTPPDGKRGTTSAPAGSCHVSRRSAGESTPEPTALVVWGLLAMAATTLQPTTPPNWRLGSSLSRQSFAFEISPQTKLLQVASPRAQLARPLVFAPGGVPQFLVELSTTTHWEHPLHVVRR